jgi:hypothetical protein
MEAMMCMGAGYFSIMMLAAALTLKRPASLRASCHPHQSVRSEKWRCELMAI